MEWGCKWSGNPVTGPVYDTRQTVFHEFVKTSLCSWPNRTSHGLFQVTSFSWCPAPLQWCSISILNLSSLALLGIHTFPTILKKLSVSLAELNGSSLDHCASRISSFGGDFSSFVLGTISRNNAAIWLQSALESLSPLEHFVSRSANMLFVPPMCSMLKSKRDR